MIYPILFIEGLSDFEDIEIVLNCIKFKLHVEGVIIGEHLNVIKDTNIDLQQEFRLQIKKDGNVLTEKWLISRLNGKISLSLQKIFSSANAYENYRNIVYFSTEVVKLSDSYKVFVQKKGVKFLVENLIELETNLKSSAYYRKQIFWDV